MRISPVSSCQGTRNMMTRSGSIMRSRILAFAILGMSFENEGERFGHLLHGLVKLRFRRVLGLHPRD